MVAPTPAVHVKVTLLDINVLPDLGEVSAAGTGLPGCTVTVVVFVTAVPAVGVTVRV